MADFVASLLTFPPEKKVSAKEWDKQAHRYVESVSKVQPGEWTRAVNKQNILDLLNPATNSIPYLYALYYQAQAVGKDRARTEDALTRTTVFFTSFDPVQIRYAGTAWHALLEWTFDFYAQIGVRDFTPLSTAMLRLDPTAGTFTSSHLRFVRLCLSGGVPSQALPILDKNIYAFPQAPPKGLPDELLCEIGAQDGLSNSYITPKSGFTMYPLKPEWVLEYYLLGATIYIGLRNWSRARLFLEYLILTPTSHHACSALQVEAYKKWILVGLLAQGKSFGLPRTHDQQVVKSMRAISKAYEALSDNFEKRDWQKYQAEMDAGVQIWHDDGNPRLVDEAGNALLRFRVLDLQKTYAALPVSRVASHISLAPEATLQLLANMLAEGHLNATITPGADAVLHFNSSSSPSTLVEDIDLPSQTTRIQSLISYIRDADRRLQLTKEYVDQQKRNKRGAAGPDGDLADQMDLTWDAPIAGIGEDGDGEGDEDIMAS